MLSSALEGPDSARQGRKQRGAFFTPSELSDYICSWAIRNREDVILEPSCGDGGFLVSAASRLIDRGADLTQVSDNLFGCDVHSGSIDVAHRRLAGLGISSKHVRQQDFLKHPFEKLFDVVVGNPPYVRFQSISSEQKECFKRISSQSGMTVGAQSSLWAPFTIQAVLSLKPGGRIGLVLPGELLSVNYAASLRKFLLESFSSVCLVTFEHRVFPDVQEEVVVLLAEGYRLGKSSGNQWIQCNDLSDLGDIGSTYFRPQALNARWSGLFATPDTISMLDGFLCDGAFSCLSEWGRIKLGSVTGNNKFFALTEEDVRKYGLGEEDLIDLCPPGSGHLRSVALSKERYALLSEQGKRTKLFYPHSDPTKAASDYIEYGVASKVNAAYKCRTRNPWWRVPCRDTPDAFLTYMNSYGPSLCANKAELVCLNSCHGLYLSEGKTDIDTELLCVAFMNSATMFGAEILGRSYGGGLLKVEPGEACLLPVPSYELVCSVSHKLEAVKNHVDKALLRRDFDAAIAVVDAVLASATGKANEFVQLSSVASLMRARRAKRAKKAVCDG